MYAIIRTGGKQYRVAPGDLLDVELLQGEPGSSVRFAEVLLYVNGEAVEIGRPTLSDVTVEGTITTEVKGKKLTVFKKLKRIPAMKKRGHRQRYTRVRITRVGEGLWPAAAA